MAKKNESTKKTAKVAANKAADAEKAVAAEQPATQSEESVAETEVSVAEETAEAEVTAAEETAKTEATEKSGPVIMSDDPTLEEVTVVVMLTNPNDNALMLRHCLRSLAKNLRGVKADLLVVGKEKPDWLTEEAFVKSDEPNQNRRVMAALSSVKTERVVLMTDRMQIIRPVNLADIAVLKGDTKPSPTTRMLVEQQGTTKHEVFNYAVNMPVLVCRTPLQQLLEYYTKELQIDDFDLPTVYFNLIVPELRPIIISWPSDGWLLPVVNSNPDREKLAQYLATKKFMYFFEKSEGKAMVSILKGLTPDATLFETDVKDADPVED